MPERPAAPPFGLRSAIPGGKVRSGCQARGVAHRATRVVAPWLAVAVKLNWAALRRGGLDADDGARVIAMLEPLGVDLVERSGGSYESPAMAGRPTDGRTAAREAYFLELAAELAQTSPL